MSTQLSKLNIITRNEIPPAVIAAVEEGLQAMGFNDQDRPLYSTAEANDAGSSCKVVGSTFHGSLFTAMVEGLDTDDPHVKIVLNTVGRFDQRRLTNGHFYRSH